MNAPLASGTRRFYMILAAILIGLTVSLFWFCVDSRTAFEGVVKDSGYWGVTEETEGVSGQRLWLRKISNPRDSRHTCYEVSCQGSQCVGQSGGNVSIEVCYPAVVISGLPKCGTSAMYVLLSKFPGAITMTEKENCPFGGQSLWTFFQSLPRMSTVGEHSLIISGCLQVSKNMQIKELLHQPQTHFIVSFLTICSHCASIYNF